MIKHATSALLAVWFVSSSLLAQNIQPMGLAHPNSKPLNTVQQYTVPALDRVAIEAEDDNRALQGLAPRYAIAHQVQIDQETHGTWEQLDHAWSLWRARIHAPDASHVNFGFAQYKMPPTGRLMIYSSDYQNVLRPFDSGDHQPTEELWTPVVNGEEMVIEVYVQTAHRPEIELALTQVGSGYRFFGAGSSAVRDGSGACNVDVTCSQGAGWAQEIPCVAAISTGGSIFCTGFMVNNTAQDMTPYFMTANHCGVSSSNASSLICYWNYQRAVCGSGNGPLTTFTTGSTFRSRYSTSDFTLVELTQQPNPAWGVTYAGWSWSSADASSAVAIHHPSGDVKKISFENQPTTTTSYLGTSVPGNGSHVRVIDWDVGTTEPGSSGSPLFDQNHRVIGQLHGGYAACGNNDADWYGRISVSWNGGGTSSTSLAGWLDPLGTGQLTLDTFGGSPVATASRYGTGCYTSAATFFELFSGSFDLSGTTSTTVSLDLIPSSNGFAVVYGANNWFQPVSADLGLSDDDVSSLITLPFTFQYPGGSTTQVRMCTNGYVWLGDNTQADYTPSISELCAEDARLTPLWIDLNPNSGGTLHYDVDPSNQAVYFTWSNVPVYGAASTSNTFQVVVRSNGIVEYRFRHIDGLSDDDGIVAWSPGSGVTEPPMIDISASVPFSVSVDGQGLAFRAGSRPVMGTTISLTAENIPGTTIMLGMLLGWSDYPSGLSLAGIGMPDCFQNCSQEFVWTQIYTGPTSTFQFSVPSGPMWDGIHMYAQAASLTLGVNQLNALSSNGLNLHFLPN